MSSSSERIVSRDTFPISRKLSSGAVVSRMVGVGCRDVIGVCCLDAGREVGREIETVEAVHPLETVPDLERETGAIKCSVKWFSVNARPRAVVSEASSRDVLPSSSMMSRKLGLRRIDWCFSAMVRVEEALLAVDGRRELRGGGGNPLEALLARLATSEAYSKSPLDLRLLTRGRGGGGRESGAPAGDEGLVMDLPEIDLFPEGG